MSYISFFTLDMKAFFSPLITSDLQFYFHSKSHIKNISAMVILTHVLCRWNILDVCETVTEEQCLLSIKSVHLLLEQSSLRHPLHSCNLFADQGVTWNTIIIITIITTHKQPNQQYRCYLNATIFTQTFSYLLIAILVIHQFLELRS